MEYPEILVLLCGVLGVAFYFYFIRPNTIALIDAGIRRYWSDKGYSSIELFELTTTEKLRYGIAVVPVSVKHTGAFSYFKPKEEKYYRKLEMLDSNEKQQTVFAEATFKDSSLVNCIALDMYEI